MYSILVSLLLITFSHVSSLCDLSDKNIPGPDITVALEAAWGTPPSYNQIAAFLYHIDPKLSWSWIDFVNIDNNTRLLNDTDLLLSLFTPLITFNSMRDLLHVSLSFNQYAPQILSSCSLHSDHHEFILLSNNQIIPISNDIKELNSVILEYISSNRASHNVPNEIIYRYNMITNQLPLILLFGDFADHRVYHIHNILKQYADNSTISYGFVQYLHSHCSNSTSHLVGYGIELSYKSTEYIATNNQEFSLSTSNRNTLVDDEIDSEWPKVLSFISSIVDTNSISDTLEPAYILGWKACHFILNLFNASSPLTCMMAITQNLPMFTTLLSQVDLPDEMNKKLFKTSEQIFNMFPQVSNLLFINGFYVDIKSTSIFRLLDWMTIYNKYYQHLSIHSSLNQSMISRLLSPGYDGLIGQTVQQPVFDIRCKDEDDATIYMNDLELEKKYHSWPKTLKSLIEFFKVEPTHLPFISRNFLTLCIAIDPSRSNHLQLLLGLIPSLSSRLAGIRIGFILTDSDQNSCISSTLTNGIKYLIKKYSNTQYALVCVSNLLENASNLITNEIVEAILLSMGVPSSIIKENKTHIFNERFGSRMELPCMFLNGQRIEITQSMFINLWRAAYSQLEWFKNEIAFERITDEQSDLDLYDYYMKNHNALKRFIPLVHQDSQTSINTDYLPIEIWNDSTIIDKLTSINIPLSNASHPDLHLWFVIDLIPQSNSLKYLLLFLDSLDSKLIPHIYLVIRSIYIDYHIEDISIKSLTDIYNMADYNNSRIEKKNNNFMMMPSNDIALILNGRIITSKQNNLMLDLDPIDIKGLLQNELDTRIPISSSWMITHVINSFHYVSTKNYKGQIVTTKRLQSDSNPFNWIITRPFAEGLNINLDLNSHPIFQFNAIIDPLDESSAKLVSWISFFSQSMNQSCNINMILYSVIGRNKIPHPRFYRFVLPGNQVGHFHNIPKSCPLLTMSLDVPSSWVICPKYSSYDLDNIRLAHISLQHVSVLYSLTHILLEGSCVNTRDDSTPRGLHLSLSLFSLSDKKQIEEDNTLVMANLGYYQLKAKRPGIYTISLRQGKSEDMFHFVISDDINEHNISLYRNTMSAISGYDTNIERLLQVYPNNGYEDKPILEGDILHESTYKKSGSPFYAIFESMFGKKKVKNINQVSAEINIFSVASGHLYERFLRIMTMSVVKHTKSTVKFWFIANFLSPTFIDTLPYYATIIGFQYELVTYKWPSWLRSQTEKQRMIWGYKILFLDVLFPLDLNKIIFVDADQIVRTDLKELVNLDLEGAPYGFTPFCDSRKDTEGYRFWKNGYWKKHLAGRSYHISALFVVDLERFRQLAAGDLLREHYQALSADKDSLSNLDQDLPNDLQHIVPIFSLPMEWLWCETWCDDKSLLKAKTIDLCNNPLTKEPKLDRAKRILPEWNEYDNNVTMIMKMIQKYRDQLGNDDMNTWKQWYTSQITRNNEHEDL